MKTVNKIIIIIVTQKYYNKLSVMSRVASQVNLINVWYVATMIHESEGSTRLWRSGQILFKKWYHSPDKYFIDIWLR